MSTTTSQTRGALIAPDPGETAELEELGRELERVLRQHQGARLVGADGEKLAIPSSALRALRLIVAALARGQTVTLVPHGRELTSQEAAAILHVSRPHLVKLLDEGVIPHHKVGAHRRVRLEDVLAYRERRAATRREKLDELTRVSEELEGGYR